MHKAEKNIYNLNVAGTQRISSFEIIIIIQSVGKDDLFEARLRVGVAAEDSSSTTTTSVTPASTMPPELLSKVSGVGCYYYWSLYSLISFIFCYFSCSFSLFCSTFFTTFLLYCQSLQPWLSVKVCFPAFPLSSSLLWLTVRD